MKTNNVNVITGIGVFGGFVLVFASFILMSFYYTTGLFALFSGVAAMLFGAFAPVIFKSETKIGV